MTLAGLGLILSYGAIQAQPSESTTSASPMSAPAKTQITADKIDMDKLSEAVGNFLGNNLKSLDFGFNFSKVSEGLMNAAANKPSPLSEKEYEEMVMVLQEKKFKEKSEINLKAADEFMSKNKSEAGVTEIVPGKLQYKVVRPGTGPVVDAHGSPEIHYTGKHIDGTVFSSSEEMGGPITIPLDQTLPGFSKGIAKMQEGGKYVLYVHPELGFGTTGQQMAPNELLIFEIEVVKAQSDKAKAPIAGIDLQNGDDEDDMSDDEDEDDDEDSDGYYNPNKASQAKTTVGATQK